MSSISSFTREIATRINRIGTIVKVVLIRPGGRPCRGGAAILIADGGDAVERIGLKCRDLSLGIGPRLQVARNIVGVINVAGVGTAAP